MLHKKLSNSQKTLIIKELLGIDFSKVNSVRIDLMRKTITLNTFNTLKDIIDLKVDWETIQSMATTRNFLVDYQKQFGILPNKIAEEKINVDFSTLKEPEKPLVKHNLRVVGE